MTLLCCLVGSAQTFQGLNSIQSMTTEAQSAGKYIIQFCYAILGIIAAIYIPPNAMRAWQGDQGSKDALLYIGIGLLLGILFLSIIRSVMGYN